PSPKSRRHRALGDSRRCHGQAVRTLRFGRRRPGLRNGRDAMTDRLLPVGRLLLLLVTTTVIVLSFCGVPFTHAAAAGACVSARIGSPFRLPDGALHPAGTLTVCQARMLSPVAELHVISVDRRPMGVFVSRRSRGEGMGSA